MLKPFKTLKENESGLASIVITVLIILLMSLIVLTMSHNSNREQRQSLDRQLSDQAFYSAESGVNDAAYYLYKNAADPSVPLKKDYCQPSLSSLPGGSGIDDNIGDSGVNKYSCVLYDKAPLTLEFQNVTVSDTKSFPLEAVDSAGNPVKIQTLIISWEDAANPAGPISGACDFSGNAPDLPDQCSYGGVRFDLINATLTASTTRDDINKSGYNAFLLPSNAAPPSFSVLGRSYPDSQGIISPVICNGSPGPRRCTVSITDVNGANKMVMTLRSLYQTTNISVSGKDAAGNPVRLKNAQVMIDSTGRANDVLRRIQVRIPAQSQYSIPGFAIQTKDSICKLLNVLPPNQGGVTAPPDNNGNTCTVD
jgi:hypothetical protein